MITSNLELIPGKRIVEHLGIVQGSTVRAKHAGKDLFASLKNLVGGELKSYTELMQEARTEAVERMQAEARSIGANGVLNVRFATTSITAGAAEILAYGSAVRLVDA
ncbi:MAG TPA: YbjQ family protein [Burkholderiaceae bacterium]|nr:YbjQ family protein [Burkholderiaceae bacterium]